MTKAYVVAIDNRPMVGNILSVHWTLDAAFKAITSYARTTESRYAYLIDVYPVDEERA